jgi:hypothetical protein
MNLRHAAALAIVGWVLMMPSPSCTAGDSQAPSGQDNHDSQIRDEIENEWYLMCPPFTSNPLGVDVDAPFNRWKQFTHSPNHDECEKQRDRSLKAQALRRTPARYRPAVTALEHCRCFSSNDSRLDQKSVREIKDLYLDEAYRDGLLKQPPK